MVVFQGGQRLGFVVAGARDLESDMPAKRNLHSKEHRGKRAGAQLLDEEEVAESLAGRWLLSRRRLAH